MFQLDARVSFKYDNRNLIHWMQMIKICGIEVIKYNSSMLFKFEGFVQSKNTHQGKKDVLVASRGGVAKDI